MGVHHRFIQRGIVLVGMGLVMIASSGSVRAATVPFTEDFSANAANWRKADGVTALDWSATGSPDGGAFVSTTFNFSSTAANDTPPLFRGHAAYGSSGGAFVGNWVSDGVGGFGLHVRHNAGVPLKFFTRFASPGNFPAAAKVYVTSVASGVWTQVATALPDGDLVFEGPFTYPDVFSGIGNLQIGVVVPASLAGVNQSVTFEIDKVSLFENIPTVSEWGMATMTIVLLTTGTLVLRRRQGGCGLVEARTAA